MTQLKCGHTIFHRQCKTCRSLEAECYQKLAKAGFEDIEDTRHSDRLLKSWHSFRFFKKGSPTQAERFLQRHEDAEDPRVIYYYAATQLLHTYPFEKPIHRFIWELHCEGKSKREIEALIADSDFKKKYKRESILNIIRKIAQEIIR